jgi:hypothetical protein
MIAPADLRYLVTFKPCGHVSHMRGNPAPGAWTGCYPAVGHSPGGRWGCQTPRQVVSVEQCPGLPDWSDCHCQPGTAEVTSWRQPALFGEAA